MQFFSHAQAAVEIDPKRPLSADALVTWHDKVQGPKDGSGRRLFDKATCDAIRRARAEARKARIAS